VDSSAELDKLVKAFMRTWAEAVLPSVRTENGGVLSPSSLLPLIPDSAKEALLALGGEPPASLIREAFIANLWTLHAPSLAFPCQRFVCLLLGRRTTHSSIDAVPPIVAADLIRAAVSPRPAPARALAQTDLARAISKHCHRCSSRRWGDQHGGIAEVNARSLALLLGLMREAVWINWYQLPHGVCAYEIRDSEGYGARWSFSFPGCAEETGALHFRGLLEPPMPDGHERGWVH